MADGEGLGRALLEQAYAVLGERREELIDSAAEPSEGAATSDARGRWTELGDWLSLAHRMGAEKVLFVRNEPVFVFKELASADEAEIHDTYLRAWCMSGPFCLFLALPGELRVYALTEPPPWDQTSTPLNELCVLRRLEEVSAVLQNGAAAEGLDGPLGQLQLRAGPPMRADERLIQDLRVIRRELMGESVGLEREQAHALIGRSILIRYLEDRKVLTRSYFEGVAGNNLHWQSLLTHPIHRSDADRGC